MVSYGEIRLGVEETIRVAIADDQRLFANGLARIIDVQPDMEVVGEAHTGEEAVSLCLEVEPDVVLMDLSMPVMDGVSATRKLLTFLPRTRVVILTVHTDDAHVFQGIKAGAQGYLLKDSEPEDLSRAIHTVFAGDTIIAPDLAQKMLNTFQRVEDWNLTANRPIRHPGELSSMILRVPAVSLYVKTWSALGAKPTPMAFSEVFTALQQSTIHGQENPFALIRDAGLYEVQKYCMLTEHVKSWAYVVMGNKKFEMLPADLQQVILESAKIMQEYEHELFLKQEEEDYQYLLDRGMEFIEVDKAAFEEAARKAVLEAFSDGQKDLLQRIQAVK
jgi:DNA-binding NarL/FixJ family response regulator